MCVCVRATLTAEFRQATHLNSKIFNTHSSHASNNRVCVGRCVCVRIWNENTFKDRKAIEKQLNEKYRRHNQHRRFYSRSLVFMPAVPVYCTRTHTHTNTTIKNRISAVSFVRRPFGRSVGRIANMRLRSFCCTIYYWKSGLTLRTTRFVLYSFACSLVRSIVS